MKLIAQALAAVAIGRPSPEGRELKRCIRTARKWRIRSPLTRGARIETFEKPSMLTVVESPLTRGARIETHAFNDSEIADVAPHPRGAN